jgi:thymidylate synthase
MQGRSLGYKNNDLEKQLGPVYGKQWRSWGKDKQGVDQISQVINEIKTNPDSRRHIVSAWNVEEVESMALPPCHTMFQFHIQNNELSCQLYQRSADMFLGVPFNIASYALLTHIMSSILNLKPGDFIWTGGDCHIYNNHFNQVKEQITRKPKEGPTLEMPKFSSIDDVIKSSPEHFKLINYKPMDSIKAPMAV